MIRRSELTALLIVAALSLWARPTVLRAEGSQEEKHHLVWDQLDEVYRCVGSALDCVY